MLLTDLVHDIELRMLNALILFAGIYSSVKSLKNADKRAFSFLNGYFTGAFVTIISSTGFALFIGLYIAMNPSFLIQIRLEEIQGMNMNSWNISALILMESIASGILFTHMSILWLKKDIAVTAHR
ncbi:MAG: hypothetical protein JXQ90_03790 [Cyclobacteriaceae bacterium]